MTARRLPVVCAAVVALAATADARADDAGASRSVDQLGAGIYEIDPASARLEFSVPMLGVSEVEGRFHRIDGVMAFNPDDPDLSLVSVAVEADSIDADGLVEDVLRGDAFFDVERYPSITFRSLDIDRDGDRGRLTGLLTIRGVSQEVMLDIALQDHGVSAGDAADAVALAPVATGPTWRFLATGKIDRRAFDMTGMRPLVGDEVDLSIEATFRPIVPPADLPE